MRKVVFAAGVLLAFVGFPQTSDFFVPASTARAPSVPAPPPRLRGRAAAEGAWGASGSAAPPSAEKPAAALLVCAAGLAVLIAVHSTQGVARLLEFRSFLGSLKEDAPNPVE